MFDKSKFNEALTAYKYCVVKRLERGEIDKWKAVKCFQDNWDVNAKDFAKMLEKSLSLTGSLLAATSYFPKQAIIDFAEAAPEDVRSMFIALYDENTDLAERVVTFKTKADELHKKYGDEGKKHFQTENAIMTYLWLRYTDKYYIYKISIIKKVSEVLESSYQFKSGAYTENIRNFMAFYDELSEELRKDPELRELLDSQITSECYDDPMLHTLAIDFGFYIGSGEYEKDLLPSSIDTPQQGDSTLVPSGNDQPESENEPHYWFLIGKPQIWSMSSLPVGESVDYDLYNEKGNKRKVFQCFLDAKVGDRVIGYESEPVKKITSLLHVSKEQNGKKIYFEKDEALLSPIDYSFLEKAPELLEAGFDIKNIQGSLFSLTKEAYDYLMNVISDENPHEYSKDDLQKYSKEDFLSEVYMDSDEYDRLASVLSRKKNIILQGAPGVGKTFAAKRLAYSMMGEKDDDRIEFVQFHQNYSYEDFVMGYKPVENGFDLKPGIFYRFCQKAANHPDKDYFFIIDEINRGNMSKIFGELLMLIENDHRGDKVTLAYNGLSFSVPEKLHIIGMMNTADRSLAMIDYALRRRFSFFDIEPGFNTEGFKKYQDGLSSETFDALIEKIVELNEEIKSDKSLGSGFRIGHSYFCNATECTEEWMRDIIDFDIVPMLSEYWFDDEEKVNHWNEILQDTLKND